MIEVIVIAHFGLAEKFAEVAERIVGSKPTNMQAISVDPGTEIKEINQAITKALKRAEGKDGVLILTDMFGGTPCNMSLAFLKEGAVEVVTGLNLPMLIEVLDAKHNGKTVTQLAQDIQSLGQKNICLASEILNKRPTSSKN